MTDILETAHGQSIRHRSAVLASKMCGCFHCQATFETQDIDEWCDTQWDPEGATALCPQCGIDSVIGDASGYALTPDFLAEMHRRWFGAD